MTEAERAQWMTIFEAAVARPGDEMNDDWEHILDHLGLGDRAATFYSLIGTAKLNGIDPEIYLRLGDRVKSGHT